MSWGLLQVTTMFFVSDTDWQCWTMVIMVWYGKRLLWPLFLWLIYIYSCCYHYHDNGKFIGKHTVNYDWLCVCVFTLNGNAYGKNEDTYQMVSHTYNIYIYMAWSGIHWFMVCSVFINLYQIWAESEQLLHASPVWISFYILHTHQRTLNSHSFSFPACFEGTFARTPYTFWGLKLWFPETRIPWNIRW